MSKITGETVQNDFNDVNVVVHYARAAHRLGLWASERRLIERWFPDRTVPLLELGCGAGRVTLGLWELGYHRLTAVDFAEELLEQARSLAGLRGAEAIRFLHADVTRLGAGDALRHPTDGDGFAGALFMFNGLMQVPGRDHRRRALGEIHAVCRPGAILLFTTHDRDADPREQPYWAEEAARWDRGEQNPRLLEFGDRYFRDNHGGHTFMHLPTRAEILDDLAATGWRHAFDALRRSLAVESAAVWEFADECRFWVARRTPSPAGSSGARAADRPSPAP